MCCLRAKCSISNRFFKGGKRDVLLILKQFHSFCLSPFSVSPTQIFSVQLGVDYGMIVTSWLCVRSPTHGFHHCRSVCSAGASWGIDAWKRWAGRWCSKEVECCYWSHCGSRCPYRRQRCLDPHLHGQSQRKQDKVRRPELDRNICYTVCIVDAC